MTPDHSRHPTITSSNQSVLTGLRSRLVHDSAQWDYIGCSAFFSLQNDRTSVRATTDITPQFKVSWLCASPICSVEDLARIFHGEPCKEKLECYSRRPPRTIRGLIGKQSPVQPLPSVGAPL